MTDEDAEKVIERLKYTKKEIAARNADVLEEELAKTISQCIADEIDNEILNRLRNEQTTWQTESTLPSDMKRVVGQSTYLHSAVSILIPSEKSITNQITICPKVDYLRALNTEPKGLTFSRKTIPISITNGAFILLDMQTETFRSVLNPNQWFTVVTDKIQSS